MLKLKNKFIRKTCWFIYGFCGVATLNAFLTCDETPYHYFFLSIIFFLLHWLALKISQSSGLRDKKIKILRDPALYWMYFALLSLQVTFSMSKTCRWASTTDQQISSQAVNKIATIAKECAIKDAVGEKNPTFDVPELDSYTFKPVNGDCDGDENNLITA